MLLQCARHLTIGAFCAALAFGSLTALQSPALAQTITVKCWKEYCVTDPDTGTERCVREEIKCPEEES